jgi:cytochrome c oxidase cbb3-type subunit 4
VDFTLIEAIWTVVVMVTFIGIVLWAWSGKRKQDFNEAANIPFNEDEPASTEKLSKEKSHG